MPLELDDHMLRDIGITRAEYQFLLVWSSPPSAPGAGGGEHLLTPTPGERRPGPFRTFEPPLVVLVQRSAASGVQRSVRELQNTSPRQ
jgi:hypothetical protein